MDPLLLIGLAVVGYFLIKANDASKLNFLVNSVGISISGSNIVSAINIGVQNPTNSTFTIKSMSGNIYLDGTYLGNFSEFGDVVVAPNAQSSLTINTILSPLTIGNELYNIATGTKQLTGSIKLMGSVNVDGTSIAMELNYNIT